VFADAIFLILKKRSQRVGTRRALGSRVLPASLNCGTSGTEVPGEEGNAFDRVASPGPAARTAKRLILRQLPTHAIPPTLGEASTRKSFAFRPKPL